MPVEETPALWCCAQCKWTGGSDDAIDHALARDHHDIRRAVVLEVRKAASGG